MQRTNQKGFGLVALFIAVVVIVVVGFVAWRIWDSARTTNDSSAQQANDLPKGTANGQNEPTQQQDPNEGYVVIKEWDVRFKPAEGLEGVEYYELNIADTDMITFTTTELAASSEGCRPHPDRILLGTLRRAQVESGLGSKIGPINGYYYYILGPQAACSDDPSKLEGQTLSRILQSLDSLEAAR